MSVNLILTENFSILGSLSIIIGLTTAIFIIKSILLLIKMRNFYKTPSVLILDSGQKNPQFINRLSESKVFSHPENDKIKFSVSNINNKKIQFVETPFTSIEEEKSLDLLNKLKFKSFVFLLENLKTSDELENQLKKMKIFKPNSEKKMNYFVVDNIDGKLNIDGKFSYEIIENKDENICILKNKLVSTIS